MLGKSQEKVTNWGTSWYDWDQSILKTKNGGRIGKGKRRMGVQLSSNTSLPFSNQNWDSEPTLSGRTDGPTVCSSRDTEFLCVYLHVCFGKHTHTLHTHALTSLCVWFCQLVVQMCHTANHAQLPVPICVCATCNWALWRSVSLCTFSTLRVIMSPLLFTFLPCVFKMAFLSSTYRLQTVK